MEIYNFNTRRLYLYCAFSTEPTDLWDDYLPSFAL